MALLLITGERGFWSEAAVLVGDGPLLGFFIACPLGWRCLEMRFLDCTGIRGFVFMTSTSLNMRSALGKLKILLTSSLDWLMVSVLSDGVLAV